MKRQAITAFCMGLFFVLLTACSSPNSPKPTAKAATITVPAITTVKDPLNLDFGAVLSLNGWNSDFPSTDVTYTLTCIGVVFSNKTSISVAIDLYNTIVEHEIIQTFYYKGTEIPNGSRTGKVDVSPLPDGTLGITSITVPFDELTLYLRKE